MAAARLPLAAGPLPAVLVLGALLPAVLLLTGCGYEERLAVTDARIRALIPGQDKTVAYLTLHNRGEQTLTLVSAETPIARNVEIHVTARDGDMMRMQRLTSVDVPPAGTVRFEPGGRHLMLFGVTSLDGDCDIRLGFADGTTRTVRFERVAMGGR